MNWMAPVLLTSTNTDFICYTLRTPVGMTAHEAIFMAVPRLQVAGHKQGNLGRWTIYWFKQRGERHLTKQGVG